MTRTRLTLLDIAEVRVRRRILIARPEHEPEHEEVTLTFIGTGGEVVATVCAQGRSIPLLGGCADDA